MTTYTFGDLSRWGDKVMRNATLVFKASAQDVFEDAQRPVAQGGRMPVDTGFLRNGGVSTLLNGTAISRGDAGGYVQAVLGAELGDSVTLIWGAAYAPHVEYGAAGRPGRFFRQGAIEKWAAIVDANAAKVAA